jgi:hypothetical protein
MILEIEIDLEMFYLNSHNLTGNKFLLNTLLIKTYKIYPLKLTTKTFRLSSMTLLFLAASSLWSTRANSYHGSVCFSQCCCNSMLKTSKFMLISDLFFTVLEPEMSNIEWLGSDEGLFATCQIDG